MKSVTDVTPKSPSALASAVVEGPVSVALNAEGFRFQAYKGGIMKRGTCDTDLNHAVLIVGYGTEKDVDYWLVKNSWGKHWGEEGYFRILRDMTKENDLGFCGIQSIPSFPVV